MLVVMKVLMVVDISSLLSGVGVREAWRAALDDDLGGMIGATERPAGYFSLRLGGYLPRKGMSEWQRDDERGGITTILGSSPKVTCCATGAWS
jgi:hypothetical protein